MAKVSKKRKLLYLQIALIAAALVAALSVMGLTALEDAELMVLKRYYKWRGSLIPSSKILIVAVDGKSMEELGRWPWSNRVFYDLVAKLRNMGAATIAIDTTFAKDALGEDKRFLAQVEEKPDVVLGYNFYRTKEDIPFDERAWATGEDSFDILTTQMIASTGLPTNELRSMGGVKAVPTGSRLRSGVLGFTNLLLKSGRELMEVPLVVRYRNLLLPSFGLAAASRFENFTPLLRKNTHGKLTAVSLGARNIPVRPSGFMVLNLVGPEGTYARVSASELANGDVSEDVVKDKIVLIGPVMDGPDTVVTTPLGENVPAVEIWANAIDNVLFGKPLTCVCGDKLVTVGIILILAIILGLLLPSVRVWPSLVIALGIGAAVVVDGYLFFSRAGVWFAIATPLISVFVVAFVLAGYRLMTEERVRKRMYSQFGRSLRKPMIEELIAGRYSLPKKGEKRQLTALTVGIKNFPSLCNELSPEKLVEFMKLYNREVFAAFAAEDAFVIRSGNDRSLALFGTPITRADHARRACNAAVNIRRVIAKKKMGWKGRFGISSLRIAVGADTGPLVVGQVDPRSSHGFSAVGPTIQLSDLMTTLCRTYRTSIVVGRETVHSSREWFVYRPLDLVRFKDFKRPVEIFELLGRKGAVTPYIELYLKVYEAYRARDYDIVVKYADELLSRLPHDGPTQLLRSRAGRFAKSPPPERWDGAWVIP